MFSCSEASPKENEKESLVIEAARKPSPPEQAKPAPTQPNPKKMKRERPSSRFGLLNDSDSEESDQEVGKTFPSLPANKAADADNPSAAKSSPKKEAFTFGGDRSPEEGSRLRSFLNGAQPSESLPKPVFSFAAPTETSVDGQRGKAELSWKGKLPNGVVGNPLDSQAKEVNPAASTQLPSSSKDDPSETQKVTQLLEVIRLPTTLILPT